MVQTPVDARYIWNARGGPDCCAVRTDAYYAHWYREDPTTLVVRDPRSGGAGWVAFQLGGWCEEAARDGIAAHQPSSLEWMHAADAGRTTQDLQAQRAETAEDVGNTPATGIVQNTSPALDFGGPGSAIGDYRYKVVFYPDRIEFQASIVLRKPIKLARCVLGAAPGGPRSTFYADRIFDPCPAPHGMFHHKLDRPLTFYHLWFSPAPFCYPIELGEGNWMTVSLEPREDQLQFTRYCTYPDQACNLAFDIRYEGLPTVQGRFDAPALVMRFGASDEFDSLRRYAEGVVSAGKVEPLRREPAGWWQGTMVCGWNAQTPGGTGASGAAGFAGCTQALYEAHVAKYAEVGIDFDILTIDAGWQTQWGLWEVDDTKWPDLRGFIDRQHTLGRKVLLWLSPQTDGLPEDELYHVGDHRLLDPNNAKWLARLRKSCEQLFGSGPGCFDADGIKLDGSGYTPPAGDVIAAKELHGQEYVHAQLQAIHDAAKSAKPDCLLDFEIANPHFAALHDMARLHDFFLAPQMALQVMRNRARIAHAVGFGIVVDVDGPRHEDYFRHSGEFGNMSLYLTNDDLEKPEWVSAIKEGIVRLRRRLGSKQIVL